MGRRNTKLEVYLQESQELKSLAIAESNGKLPWLGSNRVQFDSSVLYGSIVGSAD